jgi:hypothetical protein
MAQQVESYRESLISDAESTRHYIGWIESCLKKPDATDETKMAAGICKRKIEEMSVAVRRAVDSVKVSF